MSKAFSLGYPSEKGNKTYFRYIKENSEQHGHKYPK